MKIAFTICSNNYYAQALTLAKSIEKHNSDYVFIFAIVDEPSEYIEYSSQNEHIFVSQLPIDVQDLASKYNIIELNTSVKPSLFLYLIENYKNIETIHYFDPDIKTFTSLRELDLKFGSKSILLTPHILSPIPYLDKLPQDHLFLNYGIFNLGYLGLKVNACTVSFLKWWEQKTLNLGYNRVCEGLFVDQLWINHVPIFFFNDTEISFDPALNVAPWNLHEREITFIDNHYKVNDSSLIFFHFSNYSYLNSDKLTKYYRYTFDGNPHLKQLYQEYHQDLICNKIKEYSVVSCAFYSKKEKISEKIKESKIKKILKLFIPPIVTKIIKY